MLPQIRSLYIFACATMMALSSFGQSREEKEITEEGKKLYRSEMASWYGTDIFLSKFTDKHQRAGGYFSYMEGNLATCIFYSKGDSAKVLASFTFDSTYNVNTATVSGEERPFTKLESDLFIIRQIATEEFKSDTLFKSYTDMNPNFIPLSDEQGKRVYILTGPTKNGVVVFGNDYILTFNQQNDLKKKQPIHKNIIPINYGEKDGKRIIATMHTHLRETGDLITATDICTLMLYEKYARWGQHYVISEKNVSIWECEKDQLLVMTKKAWDKIAADQAEKK